MNNVFCIEDDELSEYLKLKTSGVERELFGYADSLSNLPCAVFHVDGKMDLTQG